MAVLRITNSERFMAELRSIHRKLNVETGQTMIASLDGQGMVLLRIDPLTGLGVQSEPLARFNWAMDEWNQAQQGGTNGKP